MKTTKEVVEKVRKQVEEEIVEVGKRTTIDLGVHGLHPDLIRLVGPQDTQQAREVHQIAVDQLERQLPGRPESC